MCLLDDHMQVTQQVPPIEHLTNASDRELDEMAIPQQWYTQDTAAIAQALIGCILVRRIPSNSVTLAARIVETEAYLPDDPASHSWRGLTNRNRAMFANGGCLYVYRIYGVHRCVNVVTGCTGVGTAVLLRAAEPLLGTEQMRINRKCNSSEKRLLSGPANLARGFGFDLDDNERSCTGNGVWILPPFEQQRTIGISPRIGISRNREALLRFFDLDSSAVSAHRNAAVTATVFCTEFSTIFPQRGSVFGSGGSGAVNLNCQM